MVSPPFPIMSPAVLLVSSSFICGRGAVYINGTMDGTTKFGSFKNYNYPIKIRISHKIFVNK